MATAFACIDCGDIKPQRKGFIIRGRCHACYLRHWRHRQIKTIHEHACATCSTVFMPKRSNVRYCSNACRQRAYRLNLYRRASSPTLAVISYVMSCLIC